MKNILLCFVILFPLICFSQKEKKETKDKKETIFTEFGTCYDTRETVSIVEDVKGKIVKINEETWAIQQEGQTGRFGLCEVPEKLKKDKLTVQFSGEIKKIAPNERMAATPFKVKSVKIFKNKKKK